MTRISRRLLMRAGMAAGVLAATGMPLAAGQRGGVLRLALGGALQGFDTRDGVSPAMAVLGHGAVFDCLTEVAASGELTGELAQSWEATPDAAEWTFSLRRNVAFHDGAPFTADDVIASFALHAEGAAAELAAPIRAIRRLGEHQVRFVLEAGNVDFPFVLADPQLVIYPHGSLREAMAQGVGTGLYRVADVGAGTAALERVPRHYKDGRAGWFDRIEARAMDDPADRMAALLAGQVDVADAVPPVLLAALDDRRDLRVRAVAGNQIHVFAIRSDLPPGLRRAVCGAVKAAVDRQGLVDTVLLGRGVAAADTPVGPLNQHFDAGLVPVGVDPGAARAMRAEGLRAELLVPADPSGVAQALAAGIREAAAGCGIGLELRPGDGGLACLSPGRMTEDLVFSTAPGVAWLKADAGLGPLLLAARSEMDGERRRDLWRQMQASCAASGEAVVPVHADFIQAHSVRLAHGPEVGNLQGLDSARIAERWWFA